MRVTWTNSNMIWRTFSKMNGEQEMTKNKELMNALILKRGYHTIMKRRIIRNVLNIGNKREEFFKFYDIIKYKL